MIDLERVKKRVEEIRAYHLAWYAHRAGSDEVTTDSCEICFFSTLTRDLIANVESFQREKADLENDKSELSGDLYRAMGKIAELGADVERLQREKAALEAQVCRLREALTVIAGLPDSKGLTHGSELHDVGSIMDLAKQALATTTGCGHKEEIERLRESLNAEVQRGNNILKSSNKQAQKISSLQAAQKENQMPPLPLTLEEFNPLKARHIQRQQVLTENGEGAKWLRTYTVVEDIDLLLSFISRLEYHQCQDHKLLDDKEQELAALQAALDEAEGKVKGAKENERP